MIDRDTPCPEGFPEHLWGGFKRYLLHGIRPGSFLTAFLCGGLFEVVGRGDDEAIVGLKPMVIYLHSRCPTLCYGSEKRVQEWCEMGGIDGLEEKARAQPAFREVLAELIRKGR